MRPLRFSLPLALALGAARAAAQTVAPPVDTLPTESPPPAPPDAPRAPPPSASPAQPPAQPAPPPPGAQLVPPPPPEGLAPWQAPAPVPPPSYVEYPAYPVTYAQPLLARRPMLIPYDGGPVPAGARVVTRARTGLIAGGASMFGGAWGTSVLIGLAASASRSSGDDAQALQWLMLPGLGPIIAGAAMRNVSSGGWMVLFLDAMLQGGGLAMLIYGIRNPAQYLSYDAQASRGGVRWAVAPGTAAGPGATLALSF